MGLPHVAHTGVLEAMACTAQVLLPNVVAARVVHTAPCSCFVDEYKDV